MLKKRNAVYFSVVAVLMALIPGITTYMSKASATVPYVNERVSVDSSGGQVSDFSSYSSSSPAISQDGRYVAFESASSGLVSGDTNGIHDIFVKDRQTGTVVRANTSSSGVQMTSGQIISGPHISDNGRFVAFILYSPGLVPGYTSDHRDVYVKDLQTGAIEVGSISSTGAYGNADARDFDLSADGRYLEFRTSASNMISGDTNGADDVFVRDRLLGTTTLMSTATSGGVANGASGPGTISCDGAYVAFPSIASNLVTGDTNGNADVFLVDRITGTVKDVTILGNGGTDFSHSPQLSCDGTTLIFTSDASNLVSGDTNGYQDIFAYDTYSGTTEKVTVSSSGAQSTRYPDTDYSTGGVSYDGRYVVFGSYDNGLVSGDTNAHGDVYLRDRKVGTTEIISMRSSSTPTTDHSFHPAISDNGKYVVYMSNDNGLVSGDTNGTVDIFVSQTGV